MIKIKSICTTPEIVAADKRGKATTTTRTTSIIALSNAAHAYHQRTASEDYKAERVDLIVQKKTQIHFEEFASTYDPCICMVRSQV